MKRFVKYFYLFLLCIESIFYSAQNEVSNSGIDDFTKKIGKYRQQPDSLAKYFLVAGTYYTSAKQYDQAIPFLDSAVSFYNKRNSLQGELTAELRLSDVYAAQKDYGKALEHYESFSSKKDTLIAREKSTDIGRMQAKLEYERTEAVAEAERKKELELAAEREKRQNILSYSSAGGLVIILLLSLYLFSKFRITRRQKQIIEIQKESVQERQKEILDSIRYAKRIQTALMPSQRYIDKKLRFLIDKRNQEAAN